MPSHTSQNGHHCKNTTNNRYWRGCGKQTLLPYMEASWCSHCRNQCDGSSGSHKRNRPCIAQPLPGRRQRRTPARPQRFTQEAWGQPAGWRKSAMCVYRYCPATKKEKEVMPFEATWIEPGLVSYGERNEQIGLCLLSKAKQ